ncbi:hypothetical protein BDN70DRAFT_720745 [Pholiota conissans]|uniref:Uncharacterized protein n=1 Tax=Pholiota conissans TaxID=109636 RepID=A0A9P6D020_9AGAR|nr:hypothetical protein BDN70DRAFT_720745 [Pholiota conissans]
MARSLTCNTLTSIQVLISVLKSHKESDVHSQVWLSLTFRLDIKASLPLNPHQSTHETFIRIPEFGRVIAVRRVFFSRWTTLFRIHPSTYDVDLPCLAFHICSYRRIKPYAETQDQSPSSITTKTKTSSHLLKTPRGIITSFSLEVTFRFWTYSTLHVIPSHRHVL